MIYDLIMYLGLYETRPKYVCSYMIYDLNMYLGLYEMRPKYTKREGLYEMRPKYTKWDLNIWIET